MTVLKDGRAVAGGLHAKTTPTRDVRRADDRPRRRVRLPERPVGERRPTPVLQVRGLARDGESRRSTLDCGRGSIVGLAGLVGSGRSEILETIIRCAQAPRQAGSPWRDGPCAPEASARPYAPDSDWHPRSARPRPADAGVRHRNVSVSSLSRFSRADWVDRRRHERAAARAAVRELSLRPDNPDVPVRTLSGGNQQKAVLARWLLRTAAGCCCWTSPRVRRRRRTRRTVRGWCAASPTKGSPSCWSPARYPRCWASPTACWCSARAGSSTRRPPGAG
ncbi:ATP-binding cassette domain-containing protein [Streptomyces echinatus]|uniref:ATP-binding cassette domain-containing protein n=1 Tax=Streptomyces echinatus TaxID=67293 RepID=UPI003CD09F7E